MPHKDPEKKREYERVYRKKWVARNKERWNKYRKEWESRNREKINEQKRGRYWANREKEIIRVMEGNKRQYRKLRLEAIEKYGGKCVCCGEDRIQFLCIHHIEGGGRKHREELRNTLNQNIYEHLKKSNYPEGFGVLCHNCNLSMGFYGFCPHQVERGELTESDLITLEMERTISKRKKHA